MKITPEYSLVVMVTADICFCWNEWQTKIDKYDKIYLVYKETKGRTLEDIELHSGIEWAKNAEKDGINLVIIDITDRLKSEKVNSIRTINSIMTEFIDQYKELEWDEL